MDRTMGRRGVVWKTPDITEDGLKLFACITMLIQTVGIAVVEKGLIHLEQYTQEGLNQAMAQDSHLMTLAGIGSVMQLIGGLAIPIFAFLLVEGFRHTSSYRNYLRNMLLTALISELPYDLAIGGKLGDLSTQNAMVTMCICLIMLKCLDLVREQKTRNKNWLQILIVLAAILWTTILRSEYGLCMVLLAAVFYAFEAKPVWKTVLGAGISLMYVTGPLSFYGIWCCSGQRKDRIPKYVYYIFYPLHLLVLGLLARIL